MSLLLIALPPGAPAGYDFATSDDGQGVAAHGSAVPALLPPAGRGVEVVAVAPASQLSWQQVTLPRGVGPASPRLRTVLESLLEEQVLDDVEGLHFALAPGAQAGASAWVAVCDRAWLADHMAALEAAGRPVSRIVPELPPQDGPLQWQVTGTPERALLLMSGAEVPGGAQALPLDVGTLALLPPRPDDAPLPELRAEPAVAALAEQTLQQPVAIESPAQRLLRASRGGWDLAQFQFARTGRARAAKRAGALWRDFLHAPLWRPARWGLALLVLANLIGLNVLAWRTQDDLAARRAANQALLTQTFPAVKVVVDAPAQMAREVAQLRQATGAASPRDLEPMLQAFAQSAPVSTAPTAIEFAAGELRLKGVTVAAAALTDANQRLRPQGYALSAEGDSTVLRQVAAP
jgi:general secretion pathway protein L